MTATVGIVNLTGRAELLTEIIKELNRHAVRFSVSDALDARAAVRWVVNLDSSSTAVCLIIDADARAVAPVVTAVDPDIRVVIWAPGHENPQRLSVAAGGSHALVSFAESGQLAALGVLNLLFAAGDFHEQSVQTPATTAADSKAKPEDRAAPLDPVSIPSSDNAEDLAMLQHLERLMAVARTNPAPAPAEPVIIQQKGLDFSVPLRELMTAARLIAQEQRSPEVLALHYIAGVLRQQNKYREILHELGITDEAVDAALSGAQQGKFVTEPLISDGVFDTVTLAKDHARKAGAEFVRIYDFLTALFTQPTEGIENLLAIVNTDGETVTGRLRETGPITEPGGESFFKPSSRDQAGFYEFNEEQVQNITTRLKALPAFQKAAKPLPRPKSAGNGQGKRVAESKSPQSPAIEAPEPPEKPELFTLDNDFPPVDMVEFIADLLLEGHLVAFASDIMFAIGADATNPAAVAKLREVAGVPDEKPLAVMINSTSQLKHLARVDLDELEPLLDNIWPSASTLILNAGHGLGSHVTHEGSIGVRMPGDSLSLAFLSMLGRPLAASSWHGDVKDLEGKVAAVVTVDGAARPVQTTIADLRTTPWKILRQGDVSAEAILRYQP